MYPKPCRSERRPRGLEAQLGRDPPQFDPSRVSPSIGLQTVRAQAPTLLSICLQDGESKAKIVASAYRDVKPLFWLDGLTFLRPLTWSGLVGLVGLVGESLAHISDGNNFVGIPLPVPNAVLVRLQASVVLTRDAALVIGRVTLTPVPRAARVRQRSAHRLQQAVAALWDVEVGEVDGCEAAQVANLAARPSA